MRPSGKTVVPYLGVALIVAGATWAVSFSRLPPADLTFCNGDEIKTVDPARVTGQPEGRVIRALFEGLVNWHPQTLEPVPGVAQRWEVSADGLTCTFHLRPDARWSDGTPVTAHDFVYSFRRFLHPATQNEYAYEMWYVVGGREYTVGQAESGQPVEVELPPPSAAPPDIPGEVLRGRLLRRSGEGDEAAYLVEIDGREREFANDGGGEPFAWVLPDFGETVAIAAEDERTLVIRLRHPVPYFVQLMGFYPMFPVHRGCVERHGFPDWTKPENLVCNGPYRLEFRRIRDRVRLVKSETYWDRDNVHLRIIDALAVKSDTTALNLYITGQVDYIPTVPVTVVPELIATRPEFRPEPYLATYYYRVNTTRPPLDDPRLRRALALAIDRREIVERVTRAGQIPARSFVPPKIAEYMPYRPPSLGEFAAGEAQRLLAEAGYPGGRGLPEIEILFNDSEAHKAIAQLVQAQWRRYLGVNVRLAQLEWASYQNRTRSLEYDVARAAWIGDYVDPNTFLDMWVTDGGNNQTGWSNADYDRLIAAARLEADPARRLDLFRQGEELLMANLPIIPVYHYVTTSMTRPWVKGFHANVLDVHPYQGVWIDRDQRQRTLADEGLR